MLEYKHLTPEEREHFVEHGWLQVKGAIKEEYIDAWMKDLFVRLGWDENDKSTWDTEYLKMPRHREVPTYEFCPEAWAKMVEIVGGEDKIDPVRERYYGDQFICNFGTKELEGTDMTGWDPRTASGWHTDNDHYRHFLDSSNNALTIIHCFTDIPYLGGGTMLCEDGMKILMQRLYDHPEGYDPPCQYIYDGIAPASNKFHITEAKKGDVIITHALLPHAATPNRLHYPRVIANPHVNLAQPWNLNRPDGDYTLCEQVILRHMGRESIPEYKPTRERITMYPRHSYYKRARIPAELQRMIAAAKKKGLGPESVDSIYLQGEAAIKEHEHRNGYDVPFGPAGVALSQTEQEEDVKRQLQGLGPKAQNGVMLTVN